MNNLATFQKYYNICRAINRACEMEKLPVDCVTIKIDKSEFAALIQYQAENTAIKEIDPKLPLEIKILNVRLTHN